MQKFVLFLDLIDDAKLIEAYENHHDHIPNSITKSIKDSGIITMEIFRFENRLVMEIVAEESFSFEKKTNMDENNTDVITWEKLMLTYQQVISNTKQDGKWALGKQIFKL